VLICFGVGMLVGTIVSAKVISIYTAEKVVEGATQMVTDWGTVWTVTAVASAVLLAAFGALFRDDVTERAVAPAVAVSTN
jgi:hypothetical protein